MYLRPFVLVLYQNSKSILHKNSRFSLFLFCFSLRIWKILSTKLPTRSIFLSEKILLKKIEVVLLPRKVMSDDRHKKNTIHSSLRSESKMLVLQWEPALDVFNYHTTASTNTYTVIVSYRRSINKNLFQCIILFYFILFKKSIIMLNLKKYINVWYKI